MVLPDDRSKRDSPFRDEPLARTRQTSVARRIAAWTSRGILTALVLVVGITFGRQILRWWADDDPAAYSAGELVDVFAPSGDPLFLRFGGQSTELAVKKVGGTAAEAALALQVFARERIVEANAPDAKPSTRELELLAKLAQDRPIAQEPGRWRLHVLTDELPIVVGVVEPPRRTSQPNIDLPEEKEQGEPPLRGSRIGLWGFGIPSSSGGWTLYTFVSGDGESDCATRVIPLPPGVESTLTVGSANQVQLAAFSGGAGLTPCRTFFDRWFADNGWTPKEGWKDTANGFQGSFRERSTDGDDRTAEVHLARDSDERRVRGLIIIQTDRRN